MSYPKKAEIITISDSEEDESEYSTPKRKVDMFPFVSLKRVNPIQTHFFKHFKGEMNDCASPSHQHAESNSQENDSKKEFEKIVQEKAALQNQLDESKKKVENLKEKNCFMCQKLSDANSIIESQKALILNLQKDVEDNKSKAVKWESKFIKMKESMFEVNSSLGDLVESCIKNGSPQFSELDLNKKENAPRSSAPCTPNMPNTESQGQNLTPTSSDTLTNENKAKNKINGCMQIAKLISPEKKFKCSLCKLVEYRHSYLLEIHVKTAHGVKNLKLTNCGNTEKSKATLMTRQRIEHNTGPQPPPEKMMTMTNVVSNEPELAQICNKDDRRPEDHRKFPRVKSVKDEDSVKLEMKSEDTQQKRILPKRARNVPLRFEEEFNTDFSIRRAKPKKCEKISISPRWPVSTLHGIGDGDCRNGFMCSCGREFKCKTDLWNHIKQYIQGHRFSFSCFICGDGFNELKQAHRHVQEVHRRQ